MYNIVLLAQLRCCVFACNQLQYKEPNSRPNTRHLDHACRSDLIARVCEKGVEKIGLGDAMIEIEWLRVRTGMQMRMRCDA